MKKFLSIIFSSVLILFSFVSPVSASDTLYFFHTDHLGSTRVVTDKTGTTVATYDYWPYGSINNQQSTINNSSIERLYTSQIFDQDSDLYFYNSRYYNPRVGNFISADTAGGDYLYVGGNPINATDPSGNFGEGAGGYGWSYKPYLPETPIQASQIITTGADYMGCTSGNCEISLELSAMAATIPLGVAVGLAGAGAAVTGPYAASWFLLDPAAKSFAVLATATGMSNTALAYESARRGDYSGAAANLTMAALGFYGASIANSGGMRAFAEETKTETVKAYYPRGSGERGNVRIHVNREALSDYNISNNPSLSDARAYRDAVVRDMGSIVEKYPNNKIIGDTSLPIPRTLVQGTEQLSDPVYGFSVRALQWFDRMQFQHKWIPYSSVPYPQRYIFNQPQ